MRRTHEYTGSRWHARVVAATLAAGATVALAPLLPRSLRIPLLLLALAGWAIASAGFAITMARACRVTRAAGFDRILETAGAIGVLLAVLGAIQLALVRSLWNEPAMIWNIDWRYSLSHAQAIARTGGLDEALDYSGAPLLYHVGPAWFAGACQWAFGTGMEAVLFGAIPLLSMISIIAGLTLLLRSLGSPPHVAVFAVGAALLWPALDAPPAAVVSAPGLLLDADAWSFGVGLMLNSYFAIAVGYCSLALLLAPGQRWQGLLLGSLGLASLIALKPQFFVGLGLLAGLTGLIRASRLVLRNLDSATSRVSGPPALWLVIAGVLTLLPCVFKALPPSAEAQTLIGLSALLALLFLSCLTWNEIPEAGRLHLVIAAALSLCVAVWLYFAAPRVPSPFGSPTWAPGATGWTTHEYLSVASLMFALAAYSRSRAAAEWKDRIAGVFSLAWFVLLATALVAAALHLISFPLRSELLAQGLAFGGFQVNATNQQWNLAQSWIPLRVLLAAASVAVIADYAACAGAFWRTALLGAIAAVSLVYAVTLVPPFLDPQRGYEAAADRELRAILAKIPTDGTLLVSSDIADPAQDFRRPANGALLTAYGGHRYFVSDLRYIYAERPDAPERLKELRTFFGSDWSPWHDGWIGRNGITHVLVHDRCRPAWVGSQGTPLLPVRSSGAWTMYRVQPGSPPSTVIEPPDWVDMTPSYGQAECLLLRQHTAATN